LRIYEPNLRKGAAAIAATRRRISITGAAGRRDIDAVLIATPLYEHFRITRTPCWPQARFLREEPGVQGREITRYGSWPESVPSRFCKWTPAALQPVLPDREADGRQRAAGKVTHVNAQWNRNPGWVMKPTRCARKS